MALNKNKPEKLNHPSLQLKEDISFFSKEVIFQRIGWVMMLLVLVLGCLGLFGTGLLSIKQQQIAGIRFEYEHYLRFETETELIFRLPASQAVTSVSFPLSYHEKFKIEQTMPEATQVIATGNHVTYYFATGGVSEIRIFIKPSKAGTIPGRVIVDKTTFSFSQFVYP